MSSKVGQYWGKKPKNEIDSWQKHPYIKKHINSRISGNPAIGMMGFFKSYFNMPVTLALSLGCGFGFFEREAIKNGLAKKIFAVDISDKAIDFAETLATENDLGDAISYATADLNNLELPTNTYEAVFGLSSIHHVERLEDLFQKISNSMRKNGLFCLNEYIGPNQFQSSSIVAMSINYLLKLLPKRYRRNLRSTEVAYIEDWEPPALSWFKENDPSEAIRSVDILPKLKHYFDIVEMRPFGGAILHHFLSGIAGNFDENKEADRAFLDLFINLEMNLEAAGIVQSDFAIIICKPK